MIDCNRGATRQPEGHRNPVDKHVIETVVVVVVVVVVVLVVAAADDDDVVVAVAVGEVAASNAAAACAPDCKNMDPAALADGIATRWRNSAAAHRTDCPSDGEAAWA